MAAAFSTVAVLRRSACRGGERERDFYILPWLQVRITGPRHHLTSSLLTVHRGQNKTRNIYMSFKYGLSKYAAWFVYINVWVHPLFTQCGGVSLREGRLGSSGLLGWQPAAAEVSSPVALRCFFVLLSAFLLFVRATQA